MRISISLPVGADLGPFHLTILQRGGGRPTHASVPERVIPIPDQSLPLRFLRVVPDQRGYWSFGALDVERDVDVQLSRLPSGPHGWWHHLHKATQHGLDRGRGIRVGIVDEALAVQSKTSCISHVENAGLLPATGRQSLRAFRPEVDHGHAVTSLLASRCISSTGYQGMAPGAEVIFASAAADDSKRLRSGRVSRAIHHLVYDRECDIISISAGESRHSIPEIEAALMDAWDRGSLCFLASGNTAEGEILYPARYPDALSVAALGMRGFAPRLTAERVLDDESSRHEVLSGFYQWYNSTVIGQADFIAAGSNVIWSLDHQAAGALNGTSFACPIAAGVAAAILAQDGTYATLPRTAARAQYARNLLARRSLPAAPQLGAQAIGAGVRYGVIGAA